MYLIIFAIGAIATIFLLIFSHLKRKNNESTNLMLREYIVLCETESYADELFDLYYKVKDNKFYKHVNRYDTPCDIHYCEHKSVTIIRNAASQFFNYVRPRFIDHVLPKVQKLNFDTSLFVELFTNDCDSISNETSKLIGKMQKRTSFSDNGSFPIPVLILSRKELSLLGCYYYDESNQESLKLAMTISKILNNKNKY